MARLANEDHEYSEREIRRLFRLPDSILNQLASAGYIPPLAHVGPTRFTFQEVLTLRVATALHSARLPAAKIVLAIGKIRDTLPPGALLAALALDAMRTPGYWDAPGAAHAMPLAAPPAKRAPPSAIVAADEHYARGVVLERHDVEAARAAYLHALKLHKDHLDARINLGRLAHLNGDLREAEKIYRQSRSTSATLSYNLAVLLEDLDREDEAIMTYQKALAQDPGLHDAHFNLSRLHGRARRSAQSLRHLLAYRRNVSERGS